MIFINPTFLFAKIHNFKQFTTEEGDVIVDNFSVTIIMKVIYYL